MRRVILGFLTSVLVVSALASGAYGSELVPLAPDHLALTTQKSPSLCWVQRRPIAGQDIVFILKDSRGRTATFEVKLPSSILSDKGDNCRCVHLKDYEVQLEPNIQYQWFISFFQTTLPHSETVVVGGVIERCDEECMFLDGQTRCDLQASLRSAQAGAWYDSISCLCKLIEADPQDEELRRLLDRLLQESGILVAEF
jgi:hypothetical protein